MVDSFELCASFLVAAIGAFRRRAAAAAAAEAVRAMHVEGFDVCMQITFRPFISCFEAVVVVRSLLLISIAYGHLVLPGPLTSAIHYFT